MKLRIAALAACAIAPAVFAQNMVSRRSDTGAPTYDHGFAIYTASRLIETDTTQVRVYGEVSGYKQNGCQSKGSNDFVSQVTRDLNAGLDELFGGQTGTAKDRAEKRLQDLTCDYAIATFKVFVDDKEIPVPGITATKTDYDFDTYIFKFDKTFGSEFNGKTVTVKLGTVNRMATQNGLQVFVDALKPA